MKNNKTLAIVFGVLAVLLSDVMCAVTAYDYCALEWGGRYAGYSAPAYTAFALLIPYGIAIAVCVFLSVFFRKRAR